MRVGGSLGLLGVVVDDSELDDSCLRFAEEVLLEHRRQGCEVSGRGEDGVVVEEEKRVAARFSHDQVLSRGRADVLVRAQDPDRELRVLSHEVPALGVVDRRAVVENEHLLEDLGRALLGRHALKQVEQIVGTIERHHEQRELHAMNTFTTKGRLRTSAPRAPARPVAAAAAVRAKPGRSPLRARQDPPEARPCPHRRVRPAALQPSVATTGLRNVAASGMTPL